MTEYPGFVPWHVAGDPWLTYDELDALIEDAARRSDERKKANQAAAKKSAVKPARRGRRLPRRR